MNLAEQIINTFGARGLKIATAESCTGGMIAAALTDVPGSSRVFDRGFVTYSNEAKLEMLGVDDETLMLRGAVSEEIAQEMALGALGNSNADIAVAVTGIAGPGGGTRKKPVGLVYMALATRTECQIFKLELGEHLSRQQIRQETTQKALQELIKTIET